ncbi:MAG: hypothetical protein WBM27_12915 [bacterium]
MEKFVTTREYSRRLVVYCLLAILAPVYLVNIIPVQQWAHGVPVADSRLNLWALTHQWKALPTNPMDIWNGNAFFPAKQTITGSDHLFTQALVGLPIYKLTENPFLAYHFVLFVGYALGAWGMFLLGLHLFRHGGAALASAIFFTVALPRSIQAVGHIQIAFQGLMPWSIYFLYRMYHRNNVSATLGFVVSTTLHMLSGWYMAFFYIFILVIMMPSLALKYRRLNTFYVGIAAVAVVFLLVLPFVLPYLEHSGGDPEKLTHFSAKISDFFKPASYTDYSRSRQPFWSETTLWMGLTAPITALIGLFMRGRPDRTGRTPGITPFLLLILLGGAFACGAKLPGSVVKILSFGTLENLPGMAGIRAPARAVFIVIFSLSILFGRAIWLIEKKLIWKYSGRIIAVLAVALVMVENFPLMRLRPVEVQVPEIYRWLGSLPEKPVIAELPCFGDTDLWAFSADYMMYAALQGHTTVNGYSRFAPSSYYEMSDALKRIPSSSAIKYLKDAGVDYLVVHPQMYFHHYIRNLFAEMAESSDPVEILNQITELSDSHYSQFESIEGKIIEQECLQSPYLHLIGRYGRSLVFSFNDLLIVKNPSILKQ